MIILRKNNFDQIWYSVIFAATLYLSMLVWSSDFLSFAFMNVEQTSQYLSIMIKPYNKSTWIVAWWEPKEIHEQIDSTYFLIYWRKSSRSDSFAAEKIWSCLTAAGECIQGQIASLYDISKLQQPWLNPNLTAALANDAASSIIL